MAFYDQLQLQRHPSQIRTYSNHSLEVKCESNKIPSTLLQSTGSHTMPCPQCFSPQASHDCPVETGSNHSGSPHLGQEHPEDPHVPLHAGLCPAPGTVGPGGRPFSCVFSFRREIPWGLDRLADMVCFPKRNTETSETPEHGLTLCVYTPL